MAKYKVLGFAKLKPGSMEPEIAEFKKANVDAEEIELQMSGVDDFVEKLFRRLTLKGQPVGRHQFAGV